VENKIKIRISIFQDVVIIVAVVVMTLGALVTEVLDLMTPVAMNSAELAVATSIPDSDP
jgi:hypothetical protein